MDDLEENMQQKKISLLEFLLANVTLKDENGNPKKIKEKRELMKLNLSSFAGRYATKIIKHYIDITKQGFSIQHSIDENHRIILVLKKDSGEIADVIEIGKRDEKSEQLHYAQEEVQPRYYLREREDGSKYKYFPKGTKSNPSNYKIRDLWTMLGRHYIDMNKYVFEEELKKVAIAQKTD